MKLRMLIACGMIASMPLSGALRNPEGFHRIQKKPAYPRVSDETLFLFPFIHDELKQLSGKIVLDTGYGGGKWAVEAAKCGATVQELDLFIKECQIATAQSGGQEHVSLQRGNLFSFPFADDSFDQVLGLDSSLILGPTSHILSQQSCQTKGLGGYLKEIYRILKKDGKAILAIPASLDVVFFDQSKNEREAYRHIHQVLARIGKTTHGPSICRQLDQLEEVQRATFVRRKDRMLLVIDENQLQIGEPIWRKTPEGAIQSFYHPEQEYLNLFNAIGLKCTEIKRPCFFGKLKWEEFHNTLPEGVIGLGSAYMTHHPFTLFYVQKKVKRIFPDRIENKPSEENPSIPGEFPAGCEKPDSHQGV